MSFLVNLPLGKLYVRATGQHLIGAEIRKGELWAWAYGLEVIFTPLCWSAEGEHGCTCPWHQRFLSRLAVTIILAAVHPAINWTLSGALMEGLDRGAGVIRNDEHKERTESEQSS
jgi:hypothetical protein